MRKLVVLLLCLAISALCVGQASFFNRDTIEFDMIVTDSGQLLGCHTEYLYRDTLVDGVIMAGSLYKTISCYLKRRERTLYVDKKRRVFWYNKAPGTGAVGSDINFYKERIDDDWYEKAKCYPYFKVVKKRNRIYYRKYKHPRAKLIQGSLNEKDTVQAYQLSSLEQTIPKNNDFDPYLYYVKDTILIIGNYTAPCYIFKGTMYTFDMESIDVIKFIEKSSLLPLLVEWQYNQDKSIYDGKIFSRAHDKFLKTEITAPRAYIDILVKQSRENKHK